MAILIICPLSRDELYVTPIRACTFFSIFFAVESPVRYPVEIPVTYPMRIPVLCPVSTDELLYVGPIPDFILCTGESCTIPGGDSCNISCSEPCNIFCIEYCIIFRSDSSTLTSVD